MKSMIEKFQASLNEKAAKHGVDLTGLEIIRFDHQCSYADEGYVMFTGLEDALLKRVSEYFSKWFAKHVQPGRNLDNQYNVPSFKKDAIKKGKFRYYLTKAAVASANELPLVEGYLSSAYAWWPIGD